MNDELQNHARTLADELARLYPEARCSLNYATPFQLLVATILSAQCTDAQVNRITPALFARFPDPHSLARADLDEVESLVQSTGFYRNKAKNIITCAAQIVENHAGQVPDTLEALVELAGVGRKTANVILGVAFDKPGLAVDTHVTRLSQRLGLTQNTTPEAIETDLCALLPPEEWASFGLRVIFHGRNVCHARKPMCEKCELEPICAKKNLQHPASAETIHEKSA
jgi:endonuclease-3